MPSGFEEATPAQLAFYDQCVAKNLEDLDELIIIWRTTSIEEPEHYALAGLAKSLWKQVESEKLAELLAVAIRKYGGPRFTFPPEDAQKRTSQAPKKLQNLTDTDETQAAVGSLPPTIRCIDEYQ